MTYFSVYAQGGERGEEGGGGELFLTAVIVHGLSAHLS